MKRSVLSVDGSAVDSSQRREAENIVKRSRRDVGRKPSEQEGTDVSVAGTEVTEPEAVRMFI